MRWLLAAFTALIVAGIATAQVPGGHEAFNYWFNGTKWVETSSTNPMPMGVSGGTGGATLPQVGCNQTALYDAATSGSTQMVTGVAGQTVYVCGYSMFSAGTVNVELDGGTGVPCTGSPVKIVPAYQFTTQAGMSDQSSIYRGLKTAAGAGLCIKTNAAVPVQAIVYYAQF